MISEILGRIASALDAARVPYMVIGGQAVLVHGEPRLTRDIDITLGASLDRLAEVVAAAQAAGLQALVDPQTFARETMVLPCSDAASGMRVDLVFSDSDYEQQALRRARTVHMGAVAVRFVSPEDLVIHKVIAGRERDLEDVRSVVARQPKLDLAFIERTLREFAEAVELPLLERWRQATRKA
ncbi:MAG: nucleotidyl transferase AbiEii/AbiGii toxin family protein [Planctomycetota bacterium]